MTDTVEDQIARRYLEGALTDDDVAVLMRDGYLAVDEQLSGQSPHDPDAQPDVLVIR